MYRFVLLSNPFLSVLNHSAHRWCMVSMLTYVKSVRYQHLHFCDNISHWWCMVSMLTYVKSVRYQHLHFSDNISHRWCMVSMLTYAMKSTYQSVSMCIRYIEQNFIIFNMFLDIWNSTVHFFLILRVWRVIQKKTKEKNSIEPKSVNPRIVFV